MNQRSLRTLIAINVILLGLLAVFSFSPKAEAQSFGAANKGSYLMVTGNLLGKSYEGIYILDVTKGMMITVGYSRSRQTKVPAGLQPIGFRNITDDFVIEQGR